MRNQDQRSQPSQFIQGILQKEQSIINNLDYVKPINRSMKQTSEKYFRKLNSSHSTGVITGFQPQGQPTNLVTWQRPIRDQLSQTHTPPPTTNSILFRREAPEVPENEDELVFLRKELGVYKRDNEGLQRAISINKTRADEIIGQLEVSLRAARADNDRIKASFEATIKQANDGRDRFESKPPACTQCPYLHGRIRDLEIQLSELTKQLDSEMARRTDITRSSQMFREGMNGRLSELENKFRCSNEQILRLEQKNLELTRRLSEREYQLTTQITTLTEEYHSINQRYQRTVTQCTRLTTQVETLEYQYRNSVQQLAFITNKIQALNVDLSRGQEREKTDLGITIQELEHRISELRYRLDERFSQNKELEGRIVEKDNNLKNLSEEFCSALERIDQLEQSQTHYKQRFEEIQFQLQRLQSTQPASLQHKQLFFKYNQLQEIIIIEKQTVSDLQKIVEQRDNTITDLQTHIRKITTSYNTLTQQFQSEQQRLQEVIHTMTLERQTFQQSQQSSHRQQPKISSILDANQKLQQQNIVLRQQIRSLQQVHRNLQNAEDYITTLLEQIQTQKHAVLHQQNIITENRTLNYQIQVLVSQNKSLKTQIDQLAIQQQKVRKDPVQNNDSSTTIELANLRIKNDELLINLQSAERFISSLQSRVNELSTQDQHLRKIIQEQREAKAQIQRIILNKDSLIQKLRNQFNEDIANRNNVINNLQRRLEENSCPTTSSPQSNTEYKQIIQQSTKEVNNLQQTISSLNHEKQQTQQRYFALQSELRISIENLTSAQTRISELERMIEERQNTDQTSISILHNKNKVLLDQSEKLLRQKKIIVNQMDLISAQNKNLKKQIAQLSQTIKLEPQKSQQQRQKQFLEITEQNKELYRNLESAEAFIIKLQSNIDELTREKDSVSTQLTLQRQSKKSQPPEDSSKEAVRKIKYDNEILAKQNREITLSLQKAEDYIAELLDQSERQTQANADQNQRLRQELQRTHQQRRELEISFEQQRKQLKNVQNQVNLDQSLIGQKEILVNERKSLVNQINLVTVQNNQLKKKLLSSVDSQKQAQAVHQAQQLYNELNQLRQKNEGLYQHLQGAQSFILNLQKRIDELTHSEESLKNQLSQQSLAKQSKRDENVSFQDNQKQRTIYQLKEQLQKANQSIQTLTLTIQTQVKKARAQTESETRKVFQLQSLVNTLKVEKSQQEIMIATLSSDRNQLIDKTEVLNSEIKKLSNEVSKNTLADPALNENLRHMKYDNEVLAKKNRELVLALQKAEDYIAELDQNGRQSQTYADENSRLRQELQKNLQQRLELEISFEKQKKSKYQLQLQVDQLNSFLIQCKQQFEKNAEQAKRQVRILQQMCGAVPTDTQSIQISTPEIKLQLQTVTYELTVVKSQKQGLINSLKNAEDYIRTQQQRIHTLINQELQLKNALTEESQAKSKLESSFNDNDAQLKRLKFRFEEELRLREEAIAQLGKDLEEANLQIHSLNLVLKEADNKQSHKQVQNINKLQDTITKLTFQKNQQELLIISLKSQVQKATQQKEANRHLLESATILQQNYLNLKHEIGVLQLERQTQIKNLENAEEYIVVLHQQIEKEKNQRQKLQQQNSQNLQLQNQINKLAKQLVQSKAEVERRDQQLKTVKDSNQKIISEMQVKLEEAQSHSQVQKQSQKIVEIDQINNLKATNQDLHSHLLTAQEFIFNLQKHLQHLVQTQAELKYTLEQQRQTKRAIEEAIQQKQSQIKKLNLSLQQSSTKQNPLSKIVDQLQDEKKSAWQKANKSALQLNVTQKQLEQLRAKLIEAQNYIFALEDQIRRLRESLNQAEYSIKEHSDANNRLKQNLASAQASLLQQQKNQVTEKQISSFKQEIQRLSSEKQKNVELLQKQQVTLKALTQDLQRKDTNQKELERKIKGIEEQRNFFKSKLIEAEGHIAEVEKSINERDQIINKQITQLQRQQDRVMNTEGNLVNAEKRIQVLNNELKKANGIVIQYQQAIKNQPPPIQVSNLQNLLSDLQQKFKRSEQNRLNLNNAVDDLVKQLQKSDENVLLFKKSNSDIEAQVSNLQQKLKKTEKQYEKQQETLLKQGKQLEEQRSINRKVEKELKELQNQNSQLSIVQIASLKSNLEKADKQVEYFRNKLLDAETYINHVQQIIPQKQAYAKVLEVKIQQASKVIDELTQQNNQLLQKVNKISDHQNQSPQVASPIESAQFFRDKLLEAQSFIHQLEQENARLISDANTWQGQLNSLKEQNDKIKKIIAEAHKANASLKTEKDIIGVKLDEEVKFKQKISKDFNDLSEKLKSNTDKAEQAIRANTVKDQIISNLNKQNQQLLKHKLGLESDLASQQIVAGKHQKQILQLKNQIDNFTKKISQLEQDKQTISQRANYSQGLLLDTVKSVEDLQVRLGQAQAHGRDAQTYIANLEEESNNLRNRLAEAVKDGQNYVKIDQQNTNFKLQINRITNQNNQLRQIVSTLQQKEDSQPLIQKNKQLQNKLVLLQNTTTQQKLQTNNIIGKLQQAEAYIHSQEQECAKLRKKLAQAEAHIQEEAQRLNAELARAEKEINTLEVQSNTLKERLSSIQPQPKADNIKQQLASLEKQVERLNKVQQIQKERLQAKQSQICALSSALQELQKPRTLIKPQSLEQDALFFKNKLLEAQQYLEQLEHINFTNEQVLNQQKQQTKVFAMRNAYLESELSNADKANISLQEELARQKDLNKRLTEAANDQISPTELVNLENKNRDLQIRLKEALEQQKQAEKASDQLIQRVSYLNGKIYDIQKQKEASDAQSVFFKGKLFEAENYITQLQESTHTNDELKNKIKENNILQEQLKEIANDLKAQRIENQDKGAKLLILQKTAKQLQEEGQFFRKKLLQAQTYINHLQKTLSEQENRDQQIQKIAIAEALAKDWQVKAKGYEKVNKELTIMNQQLTNQLSEHRHSEEIQRLQESLVQLRSALNQSQADKIILKSRIADEKSSSQKQSKQSNAEGIDFRSKLLEAESYIHQLQQQNNQLGEKVEELNNLREEFEECNRVLEESEERNRILAAQLQRTSDQNEKVRQNKAQLEEKIVGLTKEVNNLKLNLQEGQNTNQLINDLTLKLQQAETRLQELSLSPNVQMKSAETQVARTKLRDAQKQLEDVKQLAQKKDEEINDLASKLTESEKKLQQAQYGLQEEIRNKYALLNDLTTKLHQSQAQKQSLQKELQYKNAQIVTLSSRLQVALHSFKETPEKPSNQLDDNEVLAHLIEAQAQLQETNQILQQEIRKKVEAEGKVERLNEVEAKVTYLISTVQQKDIELTTASNQLSNEKSIRQEVESTNRAIQSRIDQLQVELQKQHEDKQVFEKQLIVLRDELANSKKVIENLHEDISQSKQLHKQRQLQKLSSSVSRQQSNYDSPDRKSQQEKSIQLLFLGDKLKQAEELIIQQQNQIARLTDQLIHHQNDSISLKRQLSTKRREEEDMEDAIRELSTTRQNLVEKVEPLECQNEALINQIRSIRAEASQLKQDKTQASLQVTRLNAQLAALTVRIDQQTTESKIKDEQIQALLKKNNQLQQRLATLPDEEDHEKFIELQAQVLQLKEGNDLLWKNLQELRRDDEQLKKQLIQKEEVNKQLASRLQEATIKSAEHERLLEVSKQGLVAKEKLVEENEKLKNIIEEKLNSSARLSIEKESALNQEINRLNQKLAKEAVNNCKLQKEIDQRDSAIANLHNQLNAVNFDLQAVRKQANNLQQIHHDELILLRRDLEAASQEVAKLNNELQVRQTAISQLLPVVQEKQAILAQKQTLIVEKDALMRAESEAKKQAQGFKSAKQELLTKLREAETYIVELQNDANNATTVFRNLLANVDSLKQQTQTLKQDLRRAGSEKEKLLAQIHSLQVEVELAQSDNERLTSKVSYLHSLTQAKDQQIANLSEVSKEREHPEPQQGNILPDELKEEGGEQERAVRELSEQIRSLTAELERKEEENRQLMVERLNLQDQLNQLQEQLETKDRENAHQQLHQHLVQADRANLELEEHLKRITEEVQSLSKDKAYLQYELAQLSADTSKAQPQEDSSKLKQKLEQTNRELQSVRRELQNSNRELNELRSYLEQSRQQLEEERAKIEELLVVEVENDSLKHLKDDLQVKLDTANAQKVRLLINLSEAQKVIADLHNQEILHRQSQEDLARHNLHLEETLAQANLRIGQLESQSEIGPRGETTNEDLRQLLGSAGEEIDEDILQHLENFPYLQQFIKSILYRLRLSSALQLEKSLKIKQLNDDIKLLNEQVEGAHRLAAQAKDLKAANQYLREEAARLESERRDRERQQQVRYDEALEEIITYTELNKQLEGKLIEITEIADQQKERIRSYEHQAAHLLDSSAPSQDNDLSQENYQLRRRLQSSERLVEKYKADSSLSTPSRDVFYTEFLNACLDKVVDLQREVQQAYREIERTALEATQRSQPSEQVPQDSLQTRLQELEDKLLRNAHNIREHQQRSDGQLYDLLRELAETRDLPEASRTRIQEYLAQLEEQILREHEQHQGEVSRLKDQLASLAQPSARSSQQPGDSSRGTREQLLRQITHLNNAIEIYYQESMRRKKNYRRTLESLLRDINRLADSPNPTTNTTLAEIAERLRFALENEQDEDNKQMEMGDDFIISGGNVQILERQQPTQRLTGQNREVQTEDDSKPFLSFLLSNQGLEKDDLRLLKRKVAELRSREVEESLAALKGQQKRLEEVLQLGGREAPQQLDNIMVTLANTYSRDEISQIFGSEDNDQLLNKLNQALQESFMRGDSTSMLENLLERKNRYYDSPTKLSEQVYTHLVALLSAKRDDDFYEEVDALFHDLYDIEVGFEEALRKKDELYRYHNERMNQIFNRSSSDGSEEYLTLFEREGQEHADPDPLEMRSERKPRRSEPESETQH